MRYLSITQHLCSVIYRNLPPPSTPYLCRIALINSAITCLPLSSLVEWQVLVFSPLSQYGIVNPKQRGMSRESASFSPRVVLSVRSRSEMSIDLMAEGHILLSAFKLNPHVIPTLDFSHHVLDR